MLVENPYSNLVEEAARVLNTAFSKEGLPFKAAPKDFEEAPRGKGDLAFKCFSLASKIGGNPARLAKVLEDSAEVKGTMFNRVEAIGGYLNFWVEWDAYGKLVLESALGLKERYGYVKASAPRNIIVEHTSANPIHPMHVGHFRNTVLGDAAARLLSARGHSVSTHFYVDDVGLQVAYAALGYKYAKGLEKGLKFDHFLGLVYAITYNLVELHRLRKEGGKAEEIVAILNELRGRREDLFEILKERIMALEDPEEEVRKIARSYEAGEEWAKILVREMVEKSLEGFRETFTQLGVEVESWDWESELTIWSNESMKAVERLMKTGFVEEKDGALIFRADRAIKELDIWHDVAVPRNAFIAPLTLVRSDGTTLYTTRDIAYSLWKLRKAEVVINVIGSQQTLAQYQLRIALWLLGIHDVGKRLIQLAYEMVKGPGMVMSSRRGRFVDIDGILERARFLARKIVEERGGKLDESEIEKIALGALKFFFLMVSPQKIVEFKWEKILNFNENSGPFVQYAYVRLSKILEKASYNPLPNPSLLVTEYERDLLWLIGRFPEEVVRSADLYRPDFLAQFLNRFAKAVNLFYDNVRVLNAGNEELVRSRLALVEAARNVLHNGLKLLGIPLPREM